MEPDFAPCGLLQTAEDGTIRVVNQTLCAWLGYTAVELVGRRFQDLFTIGGKMFHHTHWAPLMRMQGSVSEIKLEMIARDGSLIPMVFNALRRELEGEVVHAIAAFIARDRDRYERELVQSRKRLQALHDLERDRALAGEQMIGIVSHDLRTPLATVSMASELLAGMELPPEARGMVQRIDRAIDRAHALVTDLLDFTQARLGSGLSVQLQPIALHHVVAEAIEELRPRYPTRELVHVRSGEGDCIGDARRLAQAIGNLVSNAITYGSDAPITITSTLGPSSIAVRNHGTPIPKARQTQIFLPMSRGPEVAKDRSIGLGLFIVQSIARA
ncbi:MAG TPA: PAS domain-containing sensor histidine kinase, partial [Kofleriaceae bacterium]